MPQLLTHWHTIDRQHTAEVRLHQDTQRVGRVSDPDAAARGPDPQRAHGPLREEGARAGRSSASRIPAGGARRCRRWPGGRAAGRRSRPLDPLSGPARRHLASDDRHHPRRATDVPGQARHVPGRAEDQLHLLGADDHGQHREHGPARHRGSQARKGLLRRRGVPRQASQGSEEALVAAEAGADVGVVGGGVGSVSACGGGGARTFSWGLSRLPAAPARRLPTCDAPPRCRGPAGAARR